MKKYVVNMKQKSPHERREAAMRVAATLTAVVFVGWMATLGVRLASPGPKSAQESSFESQVAAAFSAFNFAAAKQNTLEVATSTNQTNLQ